MGKHAVITTIPILDGDEVDVHGPFENGEEAEAWVNLVHGEQFPSLTTYRITPLESPFKAFIR